MVEVGLGVRELLDALAVDLVRHADRDLLPAGEDVELGEEEVRQAVHPGRVAGDHRVEPAAAPVTAGGDTALAADAAQRLAVLVEELRRERARADTGRVGLEDADDAADLRRAHAGAGAGAARGRVRGGDEGVRAVVDVEERALAALEEDHLVLLQGLVQDQDRVGDVRAELLGVGQQLLDHLVHGDRAPVVQLGEDLVLDVEGRLDLLREDRLVVEVLHTDTDTVDLVGIGRADAAPGRADLALSEEALRHLVDRDVVRRDDVRVAAEEELGGVDTTLVQTAQLGEQDRRVDDDTVTDDRRAAGRQDSGREEVQCILLVTHDHRVAGVVAALVAHYIVHRSTEQVGGLSLAFVTPLSTEQHKCGHARTPLPGGACPWSRANAAVYHRVHRDHRWPPTVGPDAPE